MTAESRQLTKRKRGKTMERPINLEDAHLVYLDDLRERGVTNMYGAGSYLESVFDLSREDATNILSYWMRTFSERHKKNPAN